VVPWGKAPVVFRKMAPATSLAGGPTAISVQHYVVLVQDVPDLHKLKP
jgi:hypothetical protein